MYHAARSNWKFELGQCVTHISQPLPSLVLWRTRAGGADGTGREVYGLRSFLHGDKHRDRLILADSLRAAVPHSEDCDGCLLYDSGLCPGLLGGD